MDEVTKAREAVWVAADSLSQHCQRDGAAWTPENIAATPRLEAEYNAALDAYGRACELRGAERMRDACVGVVRETGDMHDTWPEREDERPRPRKELAAECADIAAELEALDPARVVGEGGE